MIIVTARMTTAEGKRDEYLKLIGELGTVEASRAEDGNLSYELFCSVEDPNGVLVLEKWQSREILAIHAKTPHFLALVEERKELVPAPIEVKVFDVAE